MRGDWAAKVCRCGGQRGCGGRGHGDDTARGDSGGHDPKYNAKEIEAKWEENVYHHPQDDMNQPFLFEEGAKYARFNFLVGYLVAQKTERPTWNKGDFFGEHADKE